MEVSDDLETLTSEAGTGEEAKVSGTFDDTEDAFYSFGKALKGRYIKVTIHDTWLMQDAGNEGKQWAYTAELNFTGHKVSDEKTVTATTDGNGTVSPGTMTVIAGEDAVMTIVPEEGYQVQSVKVTGASGEKEYTLDGTTLTIPDVQEDLTVSVSFEKEQAVTPDPVDKSKLNQAIADAMYILENRENYQADTLEGLESALEKRRQPRRIRMQTRQWWTRRQRFWKRRSRKCVRSKMSRQFLVETARREETHRTVERIHPARPETEACPTARTDLPAERL